MSTTSIETELHHARYELAERLRDHPVSEWSASLLAAVAGVIDVHLTFDCGQLAAILELVRT